MLVATAAVAVGLLVFAAGALAGGWRPFSDDPAVLTFGPGGDLRQFVLFNGQCATGELAGGGSFGVPSDAACGEPHDVEVVGTRRTLGEGRPVGYPGEAALARYGRAFCEMVFHSDLLRDSSGGVSRDALALTVVIPTKAAFDAPRTAAASSSGSRQVSCVISRADGEPLTDRFSVI